MYMHVVDVDVYKYKYIHIFIYCFIYFYFFSHQYTYIYIIICIYICGILHTSPNMAITYQHDTCLFMRCHLDPWHRAYDEVQPGRALGSQGLVRHRPARRSRRGPGL